MKRDLELVRKILIKVAEHPEKEFIGRMKIEGYSKEMIDYHLKIMVDANILNGKFSYGDNGLIASSLSLSWEGNDYLEAISDRNVWDKTKEIIKTKGLELGSVPISVVKEIATSTVKEFLFK